ncbi:ThuA domain-containing protein [Tuwongella immobilis]|uniref:ThuA-like domain-containing protein n=1 Tax=Tuwongella immobilis TaxID=692036 RepID=A0A6C2YUX8_9BACT|nr:ThuA domain-containing protein [Tuwongella immobilis]VIP05254.1 Uncharacterized protein OS=Planctomyces brasiliensis (strain ATCC 49424 / DSM 5305 / JCM 21570 / NBRC 103401 / IFAM 1448) GN=Plabr_1284 PE=4 SV=1: ThuA [Tuwongella immobilis]VTS07864.1 Uncharacterized protein OS=Planctomyces brasiliensis (strain ATCC 49424 / DSM 5305 / JCM 21570 / NBRC 103401 / IFAM 1448) GN=Plabr_1284 PE=4 SV=1: ThuA [Tuwongella immobilis]
MQPPLYRVAFVLVTAILGLSASSGLAADKIKVLIIDGQNNHNWRVTTPILKKCLEECGRFDVTVMTTPQDLTAFQPDFSPYAVIVSNYNGAMWPKPTRDAFVDFVRNGGGFVSVHAANNAFPEWGEYNEMIGVGGWGGRNEKYGPYVRFRDGKIVLDRDPGRGGSHGRQHEFKVDIRDREHPITKGLPPIWMHTQDELYDRLRGPAKNLHVLATAYADPKTGGSGENEPMLMTIEFGKGRVFHTTLGHDPKGMYCVGFATTLNRGTEWAATGKVTLPVPEKFPTEDKVSTWGK